MTAVKHTHSQNYTFGKGELFRALLDANDNELGFEYFGNTPGFTITVESEKLEHVSAEGGISEVDDSVVISVTRTGQITVDDISDDNVALFIVGSKTTHSQGNTPVTNEQHFGAGGIVANQYSQLGSTSANPPGVRNVTSVTVVGHEHATGTARGDSTAYAVGDFYTSGGDLYVVTVAGTSAGSAPTFDTAAIGNTTADGTVTVAYLGDGTYTVDVDYKVDLAKAWIVPLNSATIAAQIAALPSGSKLSFRVGYTPATETRTRITTDQLGERNVALKYFSDNPKGTQRDDYLPDVTLQPSGDFQRKSDGDWLTMAFDITVNKKNSTLAAMYVEGRAVA